MQHQTAKVMPQGGFNGKDILIKYENRDYYISADDYRYWLSIGSPQFVKIKTEDDIDYVDNEYLPRMAQKVGERLVLKDGCVVLARI